jgi:hypothetical protein
MTKSTKEKLSYMKQYESSPKEIKKREERNLARQHALKEGKAHKGDGTEVDHIKPLRKGGKNVAENTRVIPASVNRAWRKGKKGYDE